MATKALTDVTQTYPTLQNGDLLFVERAGVAGKTTYAELRADLDDKAWTWTAAHTFSGAITFSGPVTFSGTTIADLGTVTTANIDGGTGDNFVIGSSTPAAGTFTNLTATTGAITALTADVNMSGNSVRNVLGIEFNGASTQDYVTWTTAEGMNFYENNAKVAQLGFIGLKLWDSTGATEELHIDNQGSKVAYDTPTEHEFQIGGTDHLSITGTQLIFTGTTGGTGFRFTDTVVNSLTPNVDDDAFLGVSGTRWKTVYAVNGTINTSDAREKQDIAELTEAERDLAQRLKGLVRTYRWRKDPTKKHFGVIAQEVIAAFDNAGLDWRDYGVIHGGPGAGESGEDVPYGVNYAELNTLVMGAL